MENVVISPIVLRIPLLEGQPDIVASGDDAVEHPQRVPGIFYPNIEAFRIHKGAVLEGDGAGLAVPVELDVGIGIVIPETVE